MSNLADEVYELHRQIDRLEDSIYHCLLNEFKHGIVDIKSYDDYDSSIEFWVVKGTVLDGTAQKILWKLGFARCWLCVKDGTKEDEVYYHRIT